MKKNETTESKHFDYKNVFYGALIGSCIAMIATAIYYFFKGQIY